MLSLFVWAALALFAALQVGDALTTARVLAQGGREVNAVMVRLALAVKGVLVMGFGLIVAVSLPPLAAVVVLAILCVIYGWVVWHNLGQIR